MDPMGPMNISANGNTLTIDAADYIRLKFAGLHYYDLSLFADDKLIYDLISQLNAILILVLFYNHLTVCHFLTVYQKKLIFACLLIYLILLNVRHIK